MVRPDGSLDRARLGQLVFGDDAARARLEALMHPVVGRETLRRLEAARAAGAALVVLDIPLLLERRAGRSSEARSERRQRTASDSASEVIVVYAPEAVQIERQILRDGVSRGHAVARIRAQLSIEEKRKLADYVIDNSGTLEDTERQVRELYAQLVGLR
jgi:dephospho-CoA kinase